MSLPQKMSLRVSSLLLYLVSFCFIFVYLLCHSQSFLLDVGHAMVFEKLLTTLSTLSTHEISIPTSMHNAHELFIFKILLRIFCKIYILPNKLMCIRVYTITFYSTNGL